MTDSNWGGKRPGAGSGGARPGAGRPAVLKFKNTRIEQGEHVVIERSMVNDVSTPPEMWELVDVQDGYFELQRTVDGTSEIMSISTVSFFNGETE